MAALRLQPNMLVRRPLRVETVGTGVPGASARIQRVGGGSRQGEDLPLIVDGKAKVHSGTSD
jgi:hypothetical protein